MYFGIGKRKSRNNPEDFDAIAVESVLSPRPSEQRAFFCFSLVGRVTVVQQMRLMNDTIMENPKWN